MFSFKQVWQVASRYRRQQIQTSDLSGVDAFFFPLRYTYQHHPLIFDLSYMKPFIFLWNSNEVRSTLQQKC